MTTKLKKKEKPVVIMIVPAKSGKSLQLLNEFTDIFVDGIKATLTLTIINDGRENKTVSLVGGLNERFRIVEAEKML